MIKEKLKTEDQIGFVLNGKPIVPGEQKEKKVIPIIPDPKPKPFEYKE